MLKKLYNKLKIIKIFNKRVYSYIIVAVLAIVTNLVGYQVTIDNLETSLSVKSKDEAELVKNNCDSIFYEIQTVAYSLQQSRNVRKVAGTMLGNYERQVLARDIINEIDGRIRKIAVDNMTVIFRDADLCVSNQVGISNIDLTYDMLYSTHFKTQDEFLNSIYGASGWSIFTKKANENASDDSQRMYLVLHMAAKNKQVAIVAQINQKRLSEKLFVYRDSVEKVLLLDKNDNVLYGEEFLSDIDGKHYIKNTAESDVLPVVYARMVPEDMYSSSILKTKRAFILGYILCLLLALVCGIIFSKIESAREKKIMMRLEEKSREADEALLRKLLLSNADMSRYNTEGLHAAWSGKNFVVMLFDFVDNLEDYTVSGQQRIEHYFLTSYLRTKISDRFADDKVAFFVINDMCVGVLNYNHFMDMSEMKDVCEELCGSIGEEFSIDLRCALSNVTEDITELHAAFENVCEIMNFRFLGDDKIVFVYDDVMLGIGQKPLKRQIDNNLFEVISEQGDAEKACRIINDYFNWCMESRATLCDVRMVLYDIVNILLKIVAQADIAAEIECKTLYMLITNISGTYQLREIRHTILRYTKELCRIIETKKRQDDSEFVFKVKEFIKNNYADPELNVNILADELGRNRSSLSKRFKAETGIVLSEYIISYRLKKACEYLEENYTINDIVERTGFSTSVVFYRAFKKRFGMSPTEFKRMKKQKNIN